MAIAGALIGGALGAFGEKPKIPDLETIKPSEIQAKTIKGNLGQLPELEKLGAEVNRINTQNLINSLNMAVPGGVSSAQKLIASQLRGEIPEDISQSVQQSAAETALNLGVAGGGIAKNLTARDLGLTSLGIQQQGLQNFGAFSSFATAPSFDVRSMFFTPQQRLEFAFEDRAARFQRDLMAAQVAAAPDPATVALSQEIDRFFNTWAHLGAMAAGMGVQQGIGGGGGAGTLQTSTGGGGGGGIPGLANGQGV